MGKENRHRLKIWRGLVVFVSSIVLIYLAFSGGFILAKRGVNPKIIPGSLINTDVAKPANVDFSLFWDAWSKTHKEFFGKTNDQQMVYGAINGALGTLNDPYTVFLDPELNKKFREEIAGQFDGIGAELSARNGHLVVIAPLEGTPAAKAGIMAGDYVDAINGQKTDALTVDQAVDLIRGPKGTGVTLTITRNGTAKDYKIERDTIVVKSVSYSYKDVNGKKVAILKINQFGDDTVPLVNQFADDCVQKKCQNIIIDLRNNPGGYLDGAIDVGSLFIKNGVIVKEVEKSGAVKDYTTTQQAKLAGKSVVVLINGGSASAAEILAGAISDHSAGILMGEKSFGKGSVQSVEDLQNGAALKVTVAKWETPNGTAIDKVGITPKIEVKMTEDDINNNRDPQLDAALQEITK